MQSCSAGAHYSEHFTCTNTKVCNLHIEDSVERLGASVSRLGGRSREWTPNHEGGGRGDDDGDDGNDGGDDDKSSDVRESSS